MISSNPANAMQGKLGSTLLLIASVILVACFGYGVSQLASSGHTAFNTGSQLPWGQPVSTYVHFALASSGLGLLASLALVFGFRQYRPIAKRCIFLSLIMLVSGMAVLALELGHLFRMIWAIPTGLQIQSAMFWMGVLYGLDMVFLLWKFSTLQGGDWDGKTSKQVGVASFIGVLLASGNLALIFGMMSMRPFWFDGLLPVYFYVTAVTSGVAAVMFFSYMAYGFQRASMPKDLQTLLSGSLAKLFAALLGATLVLIAVRAVTGLYSNNPEVSLVWTDYLFSSAGFNAALWIGLLLPFVLMLRSSTQSRMEVQVLAAALVFLGLFAERFYFVVGGQVVPLFKGTWQPNLISYTPSATEWALTIMGFALVVVLYVLGEKFLNLGDAPKQSGQGAVAEKTAVAT